MDIKLNLINSSNNSTGVDVVIFQKNYVSDIPDPGAVAWRVVKDFKKDDCFQFAYPVSINVSAVDCEGDSTLDTPADHGGRFLATKSSCSIVLTLEEEPVSAKETQVANDLEKGTINANIKKDGRLLATKTDIAPGQKAVFQIKPIIFIGVKSAIEEGQVLSPEIVAGITTKISLARIASADIIMTGGDKDDEYSFALENVETNG